MTLRPGRVSVVRRRSRITPAPRSGAALDLDEPALPDGELARLQALWLSVFDRALADALSDQRLERERARAWLARGPAAWPPGLLLTLHELGFDDARHWRAAVLPRLRERWRVYDDVQARMTQGRAWDDGLATKVAHQSCDIGYGEPG